MLNRLRYGPARPAAGRFRWSRIVAALALVTLSVVGLRPVPLPAGGDDLALAPEAAAVVLRADTSDRAILPDPGPDGALPRATAWRILRAKAERGPGGTDGAPPDAPHLAPADEPPDGSGAPPVLASTDHRAFHLRLVGTPRTPTGPPLRPT